MAKSKPGTSTHNSGADLNGTCTCLAKFKKGKFLNIKTGKPIRIKEGAKVRVTVGNSKLIDEAKKNFQVAIMHGHSRAWQSVERWISEAGYTPRVLKKEFKASVIFNRLRDVIWDEIHAVVIILSADDKMPKGKFRGRQNVVFELGYCFGAFDSLDENGEYTAEDAILFLKEEKVETFADIDGLTYISYHRNNLWRQRENFIQYLNKTYEKASVHYDL